MGGAVEAAVNIVKKAVNVVVKAVSSVFSAVGNAIGGVFGGLVPDVGIPDLGNIDPGASADGVKITKNGTNLDIPVIYGFRRVGGRIIFAETNGDSNKYLYVVYVICEGEIEGVKRVLIQDVELPSPGNKYNNGEIYTITSGRFANRLKIQIYNGTESQTQSSLANESKSWGNRTRQLPGVAYCVARYEWKKIETQEDSDANPYTGGIPSIQFDTLGKKVYNVINHTGGEDLANDYSGLTKTFSYNPVSCVLDYLMNTRWGCAIPKEEINADSFKTAAIKCAQQITYSTGQTGKAMTMNAVVSTKATLLDNVKRLLTGSRAFMPFIQGRYKLKVEDGGNEVDITSATLTSAYDLSETELLSDVTLQGEQKANKYNQVIVRYVDPDKDFTEQEAIYTESADVTADGEDLIGDFDFSTVSNPNIAQDLARMIYKKSRNQRYINFTATPELLDVEPGDIIRVSSEVLNLTSATFRVVNITINEDGTVQIQAREHTASVYPFVSGPQIVIPSQLYKPDNYSLVPVPKPTPSVPISVAPPNDSEDLVSDPNLDSGGLPGFITQPVEGVNDILPDAPDLSASTSVTKFQTSSTGGDSTTALLVNTSGYRWPINTDFAEGERNGVLFSEMDFKFHPPQDQTIDTVRFYYYSVSTKLVTRIVDKPINYNNITAPQHFVLDGMNDDLYLIPRFRNSSDNREYLDGSQPVSGYGQVAYTNLKDQYITGTNFEAALNNVLQSKDFRNDPNVRSTSHNLGG
jgi:hypothetical protein